MPTSKGFRIGMRRCLRQALLGAVPLALVCVSGSASAQIAGTTAKPLPNVLLLVDTSGSMERMGDNSLPSANRIVAPLPPYPTNACAPGLPTNPNRWGMLLQALTGNMQPYYSCDKVDRAGVTNTAFKTEFQINGVAPYDADYFLPYHRPLTGATAPLACAFAPGFLPGASPGSGVGPLKQGAGGKAEDFPPNSFVQVNDAYLKLQYGVGAGLTVDSTTSCTFDQAGDGQLDAARDYVRFGLMTFDNDPSPAVGVNPLSAIPPTTVDTINPFLGQWSYVTAGNTLFNVPTGPIGVGKPAGCPTPTVMEVGARHGGAPPWEGRLVGFPPSGGDIYDIESTNAQIQQVLLGTRPYGATPIEGMLTDAKDYLLTNPLGPKNDPYVAAGCRAEYIILLTDGAPNLDLRPSCQGGGGECPFDTSASTAFSLYGSKIPTYVIGFSVNGAGDANYTNDGFPAGFTNCKAWYTAATGGNGDPQTMSGACTLANPPLGSTAQACCKLNEIAYNGSGGAAGSHVGPYFAETQADLVLSFGRILGGVARSATTRTLPGYAPAVTIATVNNTASFIASFIPNAEKVWSGEIDRTRSICLAGVPQPQLPESTTQGDSYALNLATQTSTANGRLFISVDAATTTASPIPGTVVDSARTIRPDVVGAPDGIPAFSGTEVAGAGDTLKTSAPNWAEAMDILPNNPNVVPPTSPTCKRSRGVATDGSRTTVEIPALTQTQCRDVMWGFETAVAGAMTPAGAWDFNVRCPKTGNLDLGYCSISSSVGCTVSDPTACGGGLTGEVCVPQCSALGAIFHSSPVIVGTPSQFLRDDFYAAFAATHASRRPTMFVASADGVLHAFKALANQTFDPGNFEMWAFVPPAVLPKISTNYPTGQQILLDGTPVVKDTVWDRKVSDTPAPIPTPIDSKKEYHTTLVAGMGAGGGGYYALNVTDPDCGGFASNPQSCTGAGKYTAANKTVGPHFLWQLTDVEWIAGDHAKISRTARDATQLVALFGKESGTPAITTLQVDPDGGGARQIGVAILPGGIDGPPVKIGPGCTRAMDAGLYNAVDFDFSDGSYKRRTIVRQWGTDCAAAVPGRGVTIVRLDTGEVLRHFGRMSGGIPQDAPLRMASKITPTPFDSPMIGTPVVYPNIVGATGQKIFIGDADGTVWRIDVSLPDPTKWKATLFQDLPNLNLVPVPGPAQSQPIRIPPVLSLDPTGGVVINVATGDQENIIVNPTERNWVYSIQEARPTAANTPSKAVVRWYKEFSNAQRVTGPMTVFDRTLYFATYTPSIPSNAPTCDAGGQPILWGMDFFNQDIGGIANGGAPRWCPFGSVDTVTGTGACTAVLTQFEAPTSPTLTALKGSIIPGVTIQATQACAQFDATAGDPALTSLTATTFTLAFGATSTRTSGSPSGTPTADRRALVRPLPRTTASVDAWALVVD